MAVISCTLFKITMGEIISMLFKITIPCKDMLTWLRYARQLSCHVMRSIGLAKATAQGGRRKNRQRKRWDNNIPELMSLRLSKTIRGSENRGLEDGGYQIICGTPNGLQDYGIVSEKVYHPFQNSSGCDHEHSCQNYNSYNQYHSCQDQNGKISGNLKKITTTMISSTLVKIPVAVISNILVKISTAKISSTLVKI